MKKQLSLLAACALFGFGCSKPTPEAVPNAVVPVQPAAPEATTTTKAINAPAPAINTAPTPKPVVKPVPKPTVITKPSPAYQIVNITASSFSPQIIAVFEGDGVTWVNKDTQPHTSQSDGVLLWASGSIAPGGRYSHIFPSTGTYNYSDGNNTRLQGKVVVTKRPQ